MGYGQLPAGAQLLAGKIAVVTGADGALGTSIVQVFREQGATVVGVDLTGADCLHADVASAADNQRVVEEVVHRHGTIDVLVLNAGVQRMSPIVDFPPDEWDRLLGVMLTGPFHAMRSAWPFLTSTPGGRILATASTSSFIAEKYKSAYVAAKHGLLGLIKVAALEGAEHQLTANSVAPSWMRTPLVENQVAERVALLNLTAEQVIADMVGEQAEKRFVETVEVASTLAFLASPAASGITGSCIPVDLGALV